ncbi:MAG: hypothetical protein KF830_07845 [Planctomycetes bacterium]|nr:hypothetical protein [Planctomycetota bacterium]
MREVQVERLAVAGVASWSGACRTGNMLECGYHGGRPFLSQITRTRPGLGWRHVENPSRSFFSSPDSQSL